MHRNRPALFKALPLSLCVFVFVLFYVCLLAGGGTARPDALSLLYVRPIAVIAVTVYLATSDLGELRSIRAPLILLGTFAVLLMLQLVPLPITLWQALPGHAVFAGAGDALGGWQPLSISPDRTLNTLISLVVPFAALMAAHHGAANRRMMLTAIILGGLASGGVAMMQLALGSGSAPYLYRLTTEGAVGLFSNPNHQAVMLACLIPMIAFWLATSPKQDLRRDLGAVSIVCLVLVLVMVTGSRSGLAVSLVGLLCAFALHDAYTPRTTRGTRQRYRAFYLLVCVIAAAMTALAFILGRNVSVDRFSELNVTNDLRVADFHLFLQSASSFFPFGSGGGTFDPAFRLIEPASIIKKTYVNHAHNELIETAITLGLPGLLLVLAFIMWVVTSIVRVLAMPRREQDRYAVLGVVLIAMLLLASLTDYLLRTPLMGAFFAVACAWLSMASVAAKDARRARAVVSRSQADNVQVSG